jgi:hypothetical protein
MATTNRCNRCLVNFRDEGYRMAGRLYCCQSCSVGSACEHQGVHRGEYVRRYDSMFDRFRDTALRRGPYESRQPAAARTHHDDVTASED